MNSKVAVLLVMGIAVFQLTGCGGGGSGTVIPAIKVVQVAETAADSSDGTPPVIINSRDQGSVSVSLDTPLSRPGITMNYMVHDAASPISTKGLVVLISGGYISTDVRLVPASNVFLSRSAHLFAENGYKVLTMEHSTDYSNYYPDDILNLNTPADPNDTIPYDPEDSATWADGAKNYAWYDEYRASPDHSSDLSDMVDLENSTNLPVFLVGYGRGAISVAANASLNGVNATPWTVQGIVMVSPATHGGRAFLGSDPVPTNNVINVPTFITYHNDDTCQVFPANATTVPDAVSTLREKMITNGNSIDSIALTGGFESPDKNAVDSNGDPIYNPCDSLTLHGFLGIESGTVKHITDWIDDQLGF